jgi:heme/copper-type cytochrome/quinol oxidase subunit 4
MKGDWVTHVDDYSEGTRSSSGKIIIATLMTPVAVILIIIGSIFLYKHDSNQYAEIWLRGSWICWIIGGTIGFGLCCIILAPKLCAPSEMTPADTSDGKGHRCNWALVWNYVGLIFFLHMATAGAIALYVSSITDAFRVLPYIMLCPFAIDLFALLSICLLYY